VWPPTRRPAPPGRRRHTQGRISAPCDPFLISHSAFCVLRSIHRQGWQHRADPQLRHERALGDWTQNAESEL